MKKKKEVKVIASKKEKNTTKEEKKEVVIHEQPSEKPAVWLFIRLSDGKLYRLAAERVIEIRVQRENPGIDMRSPEFKEKCAPMFHYPLTLIKWMEQNISWLDVMLFAMQTLSQKVVDPAAEWKTCVKGVLYEGEEL